MPGPVHHGAEKADADDTASTLSGEKPHLYTNITEVR